MRLLLMRETITQNSHANDIISRILSILLDEYQSSKRHLYLIFRFINLLNWSKKTETILYNAIIEASKETK